MRTRPGYAHPPHCGRAVAELAVIIPLMLVYALRLHSSHTSDISEAWLVVAIW